MEFPFRRKAILDAAMCAIRRVGIAGLGKMGLPMAKHLLARGFEVSGCDPAEGARSAARAAGVTLAGSPGELARTAKLVEQGTPSGSRRPAVVEDVTVGDPEK